MVSSGRQASLGSCLIRENKGYLNLWGEGRGFWGDSTSLAGAKECLICTKSNPRCLLDVATRLLTTSRMAEVGGCKALCAGTCKPRAGRERCYSCPSQDGILGVRTASTSLLLQDGSPITWAPHGLLGPNSDDQK